MAVTKLVIPGPFCAIAMAIFPGRARIAVADQAAIGLVSLPSELMPAFGNRSEIGMKAEPNDAKAC